MLRRLHRLSGKGNNRFSLRRLIDKLERTFRDPVSYMEKKLASRRSSMTSASTYSGRGSPNRTSPSPTVSAIPVALFLTKDEEDQGMQAKILAGISEHLISLISISENLLEDTWKRQDLISQTLASIERIVNNTNLCFEEKPSPNSVGIKASIIAVEYLHRSQARLTSRNAYRFFAIAVLVAIKYMEDIPVSNSLWSRICGFTVKDTNAMELALLKSMKWCVEVDAATYENLFNRFTPSVLFSEDDDASEMATLDEELRNLFPIENSNQVISVA